MTLRTAVLASVVVSSVVSGVMACASSPRRGERPVQSVRSATSSAQTSAIPPLLVGVFADDYGSEHVVAPDSWMQHKRTRYRIVAWHVDQQYLIAQNDASNPSDGGRWTRIDWLFFSGTPPYEWGFCLSAYKAPTAAAAESTTVANRATPRTGCNGFPFTRMKRITLEHQ